jgi:hypothetical protein
LHQSHDPLHDRAVEQLGREIGTCGAFVNLSQRRIRRNHARDGGHLQPVGDGQRPDLDELASLRTDDGGANRLALYDHDLGETFGLTRGDTAVVVVKLRLRDEDLVAMLLARLGFGQADLRQFGVGVGRPGM